MSHDYTIFIVDDDPSIRDALSLLLGVRGYRCAVFENAESFLDACSDTWQGCLLIDIRMPGMDGLSLQRQLKSMAVDLPVIIMTGHGDVRSAREAFRADALDFLEKPLHAETLCSRIDEAFGRVANAARTTDRIESYRTARERLTPREREVMRHVIAGRHNREIAGELGISVRTVEVHKARVMDKMNANSIPELVRLVYEAGE